MIDRFRCFTLFLLTLTLTFAPRAWAIGTSHWTASNEADFNKGNLHNVVATNLGDLKLSRAVNTIMEQDPHISSVFSLIEGPDGSIYAGTAPDGVLLRIHDNKPVVIARLGQNASINAMTFDPQGRLLVALSGEKGKIYRFDHPEKLPALATPGTAPAAQAESPATQPAAPKPQLELPAEKVQYIWAITATADGNLYLATGPHGLLYEVTPDGKTNVILESDENNLLSMISDGKDLLYVGTDPDGMVYRVNRKTHEMFVMYNAPESEVSALALDAKGNLYVGTAQPIEAEPSAEPSKPEEDTGRPESTGGTPIPPVPPANPKPPALPQPNPGEPNPIPKNSPSTQGSLKILSPFASVFEMDDDNPAVAPDAANGEKPPAPAGAATRPAVVQPQASKTQGNAIYRIDPDGFVTEVFRQNVTVMSMIEHDGVLLVGTGPEGCIYQVDPTAQETLMLAKVEPKYVMSLLRTRGGQVMLGMADVGGLATLSSGFATQGEYTSSVLNATQVSRFGKIHLEGLLPPGTTLTVSTRSGNVQDPSRQGWSKWSDETPATEYVPTTSPTARFLQYRLTFGCKEGQQTPVVNMIDVAYQMPNLAPVLKSVKIAVKPPEASDLETPDTGAAKQPTTRGTRTQVIAWEAEDPNADALEYALYYRMGIRGPWIVLKDKLTDTHYLWDTRAVGDGRYYVKVVASDAAANPPGQGKTAQRVSDVFVVDNTPPVIGDLKQDVAGNTVTISARLQDATSPLANCEYCVDSGSDWQMIVPSGSIYDSPDQSVSFTLKSLSPGTHQITLRATDARGNQGFQTVLVTVGGNQSAAKP